MKEGTANICQCNKCNIILIDQEPKRDTPKYILKGTEKEMQYIGGRIEDIGEGYWVCPLCHTDGNLQDNITIESYYRKWYDSPNDGEEVEIILFKPNNRPEMAKYRADKAAFSTWSHHGNCWDLGGLKQDIIKGWRRIQTT